MYCGQVKDARYVSLYPYNRSQILQYMLSILKINIAKGIEEVCDQ